MPNHQIFNERPESQDRALKELQAMGYQYIPRAEAEQKRGHLSHVLFPDVMREFLAAQSFVYRGKQTPFPDDAIGEATTPEKRAEVSRLEVFNFIDPGVAEPLISVQGKLNRANLP